MVAFTEGDRWTNDARARVGVWSGGGNQPRKWESAGASVSAHRPSVLGLPVTVVAI